MSDRRWFERSEPRTRPEVQSFGGWARWPFRHWRFKVALYLYRRRTHTHYCPACGRTSADAGQCMGRWTRNPADMGGHQWYRTGWYGSRVYYTAPMIPLGEVEPL